jgi:hypothetical protein
VHEVLSFILKCDGIQPEMILDSLKEQVKGNFKHELKEVNSLTAKSAPAGRKNSRLEGFMLAKHTAHKHSHHDEPFSTPVAWF